MSVSDCVSNEEVASSKTRMGASLRIARAIDSPLLFTTGEFHTRLSGSRCVTFWCSCDKVVCVCLFRCCNNRRISGTWTSVADVFQNSAVK